MQSDGENVRRPAILIVTWIVDELIISGEIDALRKVVFVIGLTSVRLGIEQIQLDIVRIVAIFVSCALKGVGKLDFFERVHGQNL